MIVVRLESRTCEHELDGSGLPILRLVESVMGCLECKRRKFSIAYQRNPPPSNYLFRNSPANLTETRKKVSLDVQKFVHSPLYVDAVQVSLDNIIDVAKWCQGTVVTDEAETHIKVTVIRPQKVRQTQAFVNDWVLKTAKGYKVYTPRAFSRDFSLVVESDPKAVELLEAIFEVPENTVLEVQDSFMSVKTV